MKERPDITDAKIKEKTGRSWAEWTKIIDDLGGENLSHKEIASRLYDDGLIEGEGASNAGWWCQAVTVGYEKLKGRRVLGQTSDAGFQVGVRKTLHADAKKVWELLFSPMGLGLWLAPMNRLQLEKGFTAKAADGSEVEVRSVYPFEKIRLSWRPIARSKPYTIQIYLEPSNQSGKCVLLFHAEKLSSQEERQQVQAHFQEALERLHKLL